MKDISDTVESFLDAADEYYAEYENGYVDADATLRQLEDEIESLREAVE
jgi:hypothetical protein